MFAGRGGAGFTGVVASGDEGGVGNGKGAGLTPTGPGAGEERSGMNVLPSAGGLGGGEGAEGATGDGMEGRLGATLGFVGIMIGAGDGGDVVVGGSTGGAGAAETVEGINPDGGAGVGASFVVSGCFPGSGAGGGGVSFVLGSGVVGLFTGCSGKTGAIFGPETEGAPVADLLGGAEIGEGPLPDLVGVGGEGGGNDPELKDTMAPLPPVWVIGAADGLCTP